VIVHRVINRSIHRVVDSVGNDWKV